MRPACWLMHVLTAAAASAQQSVEPPRIDVSDAKRLVEQIDAAVVAGDRAAFMRCFAPAHPQQFARLLDRLSPLLRPGLDIRRHSRVSLVWSGGRLGFALAATETTANCRSGATRTVTEDLLLVLAVDGDDAVRATLMVEIDPDTWLSRLSLASGDARGETLLACPACNYALRVDDRWLPIPNCRERSGCFESFSIFALDADLLATLSVHLANDDPEPRKLLTALTIAAAGPRVDDTLSEIFPWLPTVYAQADPPIPALRGARCRYRDPSQERATELRVLTFGRLSYLLTVEGPEAVLASRRASIEALFDGFRLQDPELAPEQVHAQVLAGHGSGTMQDTDYVNERLGLSISGPPGWQVSLDASQYALSVAWRCPADRGTLRAKGLTPPIGTTVWTTGTADRVLEGALRTHELELLIDTGWQPRPKDAFRSERSIELRGAEDHFVLLRLALSDDLLLVLEGDVRNEAARSALLQAFDSTVRKP